MDKQVYNEIMCENCEEYVPMVDITRLCGVNYCSECVSSVDNEDNLSEVIENG